MRLTDSLNPMLLCALAKIRIGLNDFHSDEPEAVVRVGFTITVLIESHHPQSMEILTDTHDRTETRSEFFLFEVITGNHQIGFCAVCICHSMCEICQRV